MADVNWDLWNGEGADQYDYCQSIYELSQRFNPLFGLEIGVRFGKSALATLKGSPKMMLVGVDPNPEFPVVDFITEQGFGTKFMFINDSSPQALTQFFPEQFDWIYIDGRHDYQGVLEDFEAAWPLLQKNGVMVFDDFDNSLDYGTEVDKVLGDHCERITGQPFVYKTMEDFGCHPSPHKDAILIK